MNQIHELQGLGLHLVDHLVEFAHQVVVGEHSEDADNETMSAIKGHFCEPTGELPVNITGFSSEFKYSSVTFKNGAYVMGAPEFVLKKSYENYRAVIESYSRKGYRVLVFGRYSGIPDGKALEFDFEKEYLAIDKTKLTKIK